jgi:prepilin-type N-terminal cleavage/methylation domain-containing protein
MKSQTILKDNPGFTIIEIIVVLALITLVGGIGLYFGFDSLRNFSFHSDRDNLIGVLQHARSLAISNICKGTDCEEGKPYGVSIKPEEYSSSYVIFQGKSYEERDEEYDIAIEMKSSTKHEGTSEVTFEQLSGNVSLIGEMIITDEKGNTSIISINKEGQIKWTN